MPKGSYVYPIIEPLSDPRNDLHLCIQTSQGCEHSLTQTGDEDVWLHVLNCADTAQRTELQAFPTAVRNT